MELATVHTEKNKPVDFERRILMFLYFTPVLNISFVQHFRWYKSDPNLDDDSVVL